MHISQPVTNYNITISGLRQYKCIADRFVSSHLIALLLWKTPTPNFSAGLEILIHTMLMKSIETNLDKQVFAMIIQLKSFSSLLKSSHVLTFTLPFSSSCMFPPIRCLLGCGCMAGMLHYCVHLAWTQASRAWSIQCSTRVKVIESSPSLLRSPMSKHMVTEHLEHV